MTEAWDGYPEDRERDSEGHVWRVDGDVDVYRWTAAHQWYEDRKARWGVTPAELVADGDTYYGRIVSPAEIEARVAEAQEQALDKAAAVVAGRPVNDDGLTYFELMNRDQEMMTDILALKKEPRA